MWLNSDRRISIIYPTLKSWAISRTSLWKGNFLIKSSVLFWYLRISLVSNINNQLDSTITPYTINIIAMNGEGGYSPESNSPRTITVRLLHPTSSWGRLTGSLKWKSHQAKPIKKYQKQSMYDKAVESEKERNLGSKLLPGSLSSSGLTSSLFGTGHLQ